MGATEVATIDELQGIPGFIIPAVNSHETLAHRRYLNYKVRRDYKVDQATLYGLDQVGGPIEEGQARPPEVEQSQPMAVDEIRPLRNVRSDGNLLSDQKRQGDSTGSYSP